VRWLQLGLWRALIEGPHLTLKLGLFEGHHLLWLEVLGDKVAWFNRKHVVLKVPLLKLVELLLVEAGHGAWILLVIRVGIHWSEIFNIGEI